MVGYSEKGWLKWKMRRGKWPDLGLNPFPFHFRFINNPPTTQSTPNHKLSTPPPPILLLHRSLSAALLSLVPSCSFRNLAERESETGFFVQQSSSAVEISKEQRRQRNR